MDYDISRYDNKLPYSTKKENLAVWRAYQDEQAAIMVRFYDDTRKYALEHGVPEKYISGLTSYAWQEGHAYGFQEVWIHFVNMIEVIFNAS